MFVCCECCVLSGRCLCDELITRPEESYRVWCVVECDLENSWSRRPWSTGGCRAQNKQTNKQNVADKFVVKPQTRLAWFQAFAANQIRTALFRAMTQGVEIIPYRRFGTINRSHLQGSIIQKWFFSHTRIDYYEVYIWNTLSGFTSELKFKNGM